MTILELFNTLKQNAGFTVDLFGDTYNGKGYAVSLPGNETKVIESDLDLSRFASLLAEYAPKLGSNKYLGAWLDQGVFYFDVSEIVPDKDTAIKLGKARNQLAVFSFDSFQSIPCETGSSVLDLLAG